VFNLSGSQLATTNNLPFSNLNKMRPDHQRQRSDAIGFQPERRQPGRLSKYNVIYNFYPVDCNEHPERRRAGQPAGAAGCRAWQRRAQIMAK